MHIRKEGREGYMWRSVNEQYKQQTSLQFLQGALGYTLLLQPLEHPLHHLDCQISYVLWQLPLQPLLCHQCLAHPRALSMEHHHLTV